MSVGKFIYGAIGLFASVLGIIAFFSSTETESVVLPKEPEEGFEEGNVLPGSHIAPWQVPDFCVHVPEDPDCWSCEDGPPDLRMYLELSEAEQETFDKRCPPLDLEALAEDFFSEPSGGSN